MTSTRFVSEGAKGQKMIRTLSNFSQVFSFDVATASSQRRRNTAIIELTCRS